jgi:hypothetical protein
MPLGWSRYSVIDNTADITYTKNGIPGDPINVSLIGNEDEVVKTMLKANWLPADPITLKSCLKIASATLFSYPYDLAPVSHLYFEGRKQDLAFQQPVSGNLQQRHHVRFWLFRKTEDGNGIWLGAATYDDRIGFSYTTGQITHHIAPDIDTERDYLFRTLNLSDVYYDMRKTTEGKNGGGDRWYTDGRIFVGIIKP